MSPARNSLNNLFAPEIKASFHAGQPAKAAPKAPHFKTTPYPLRLKHMERKHRLPLME